MFRSPSPNTIAAVTIRSLDASDRPQLERLAELDCSVVPREPLLGAEVEGRLLAAVSLADGELIADPFSRTQELRALLELRAAQLRDRGRRRAAAPRTRARAGLAGSPPGAGGRLLSLPVRSS